MTTDFLATRVFTDADQRLFAESSGDFNPMHLDAVAARRTQAGAPVVHGMHAALWGLDALAGAGALSVPVARIKVQFQRFIYAGAEVALRLVRQTETSLRADLSADGLTMMTVSLGLGPPGSPAPAALSDRDVPAAAPAVLDVADLLGVSGRLPGVAESGIAGLFPRAAGHLGAARVEALARLSTLVGMVCPGLHSIFAGLDVQLAGEDGPDGVSFAVRGVDDRFRRAEIAVAGGGFAGTVTAFVRHPPIEQPSLRDLRALVGPDEFAGSNALVVGGSRGLGALAARAIAAGGGRVVITYAVGEAEARAIEAEIGAACRVLRYDAREEAAPQLGALPWEVNQLYYFATPAIFRPKSALYVPARFREFCAVYVDGFQALCAALLARGAPPLSAFYPSSVAVESHPQDMTEYSMAKAAGELLCADMNRFLRGLRVTVSRLPRLLTDQTATVTPVESGDPLEVMLPLIREVSQSPSPYAT